MKALIDLMVATVPDDPGFDPDLYTPGVVGFFAIFIIALITVFLILDMTRRIRRTRYRSEVRERIEMEREAERAKGEEPPAS